MNSETIVARQCLAMIETAKVHQSLEVHLGYRARGQGEGVWEAVVYIGQRHGLDRFEGAGDSPIEALRALRESIKSHFQQCVDQAHALFRSILAAGSHEGVEVEFIDGSSS